MNIKMNQEAPSGICVCKTFILEDQLTQATQIIPFLIDTNEKYFNFLTIFQSKLPDFHKNQYRIYDFGKNSYINLQSITEQQYNVPIKFINNQQNVVLIKYQKNQSETNSSYHQSLDDSERRSMSSQASSVKKSQRSKQRVIKDVIILVKKWRDLYKPPNKSMKKYSLQQAAKMLGLKKKSLDDYYYQLRLGEKYNFDFQKHLNEKVGILRNFLKQKGPCLKQSSSDRTSKSLKILSIIDLSAQDYPSTQMFQQLKQNKKQEMIFEQRQSGQIGLQNKFYQDFGYMQVEHDPFLNLDTKFKKKKDDIFEEQLFF